MQSRLLRTIFPERAAITLNSQLRPLIPRVGAGLEQAQTPEATDTLGQAFSQLTSLSTGSSAIGQDGSTARADSKLPESLDDVAKNLDRLRSVTETQVSEIGANTAALSTNTAAKGATQALESAGKAASGFLGGLTASPLISGILHLFGAGSSGGEQQPAVTKYVAPTALNFDEAVQSESFGSNTQQVTYDQSGRPRASSFEAAGPPNYASLIAASQSGSAPSPLDSAGVNSSSQNSVINPSSTVSGSPTTHVTVNIQAMDSQSFLDRSHDIAQAVREAMLNMHSINDVVNEL